MKFVCYVLNEGRPRCGVVRGQEVVDVETLLGTASPLADARALLELGQPALTAISERLDSAQGIELSAVSLRSPVLQPPTIRDFSVYEGHATMGGAWEVPEAWFRIPAFYFSNPLCVYGTNATIPFPSASKKFDFELELALVVGKEGRNVKHEEAMEHVAGFMIFVDWSSRDLQRDEMQLHLGPAKGKDSANSFGPWLVTKDELAPYLVNDELQLQAKLSVNGVQWVSGFTGGMQHSWAAIVERASRDSRIVPGDVIGAGCIAGGSIPEAVRAKAPARYLQPGDVVEAEINGLGKLVTTIAPPVLTGSDYRYAPPASKSPA